MYCRTGVGTYREVSFTLGISTTIQNNTIHEATTNCKLKHRVDIYLLVNYFVNIHVHCSHVLFVNKPSYKIIVHVVIISNID